MTSQIASITLKLELLISHGKVRYWLPQCQPTLEMLQYLMLLSRSRSAEDWYHPVPFPMIESTSEETTLKLNFQ